MSKVIVSNLVSLDGYFEGPGKELDWFVAEEEFMKFAREQLYEVDRILFGRVTYEMMAGYWPDTKDNDPVITEKMNNLPKVVFSKTLTSVNWNNSTLAKGNASDEIARLKKSAAGSNKDLIIFGSGKLVSSFANLGLIDEYRIILNPVILGKGNPMFKELEHQHKLKLLKTKTLGSGVVILYYEPIEQ